MLIAFIGLGNMGGGMAANLVAAGHEVRAFDLSTEALGAAKDKGCTPSSSIAEAVAEAQAVVSMLPNGEIVRAAYEGEVIGNAPADAILIDCSTIDVASARAKWPRRRRRRAMRWSTRPSRAGSRRRRRGR